MSAEGLFDFGLRPGVPTFRDSENQREPVEPVWCVPVLHKKRIFLPRRPCHASLSPHGVRHPL
jgi:hypothetical protein